MDVREKVRSEGGFGEVWLARHETLDEIGVFKFCFDPERLRAFKREAAFFKLLKARLGKRDDIAAVRDLDASSAPFFLEYDYYSGGNLKRWSENRGGLANISLKQRIDIVCKVARATGAAHSAGIVHRDVKPSNILLRESDGAAHPVLADFGIAAITDEDALENLDITYSADDLINIASSRTGTAMYAAPETLKAKLASEEAEKRQRDVYSLGVLLYQMVIGDLEEPIGEGWRTEIRRNIKSPDLAEMVEEDIEKAISKDLSHRISDASGLAVGRGFGWFKMVFLVVAFREERIAVGEAVCD
ncbi:MAG: serine/threonine protein kinase [Planctomycetales bacterium]|nr:serine/threonine protein kinase [Planctomycetales bacterium]